MERFVDLAVRLADITVDLYRLMLQSPKVEDIKVDVVGDGSSDAVSAGIYVRRRTFLTCTLRR